MQARQSTLLVEDPATLWNLGPERYAKLGAQYRALTSDSAHLAVDINVVERYQDVYPTKKQTGVELFELVHEAAISFARVALYFENSLEKQDLALLPAAANTASETIDRAGVVTLEALQPTRIDLARTRRYGWQTVAVAERSLASSPRSANTNSKPAPRGPAFRSPISMATFAPPKAPPIAPTCLIEAKAAPSLFSDRTCRASKLMALPSCKPSPGKNSAPSCYPPASTK